MRRAISVSPDLLKGIQDGRKTDWRSWLIEADILISSAMVLARDAAEGQNEFLNLTATLSNASSPGEIAAISSAGMKARQYQVVQMLMAMALECTIKAAYIFHGKEPQKNHKLIEQYQGLNIQALSDGELYLIAAIERMIQEGRYPYHRDGDIKVTEHGFNYALFENIRKKILECIAD